MSMSYAPVYGVGLMLTSEEFDQFIAGYKKKISKEETEILENTIESCELIDYPFKWCKDNDESFTEASTFSVEVLDEDSFESIAMFRIADDERIDYPDDAYLFWAEKQPSLTSYWAGDTYANAKELVKEFKDKMEDYLPEDFGWEMHIGEVSMCCFG